MFLSACVCRIGKMGNWRVSLYEKETLSGNFGSSSNPGKQTADSPAKQLPVLNVLDLCSADFFYLMD